MQTKKHLFPDDLIALSDQSKALSHPARMSILQILSETDSCFCGEMVDVLPLSQATVSQHLRTLKEAGLIQGEVEGKSTCYCLNREAVENMITAFDQFLGPLRTAVSMEPEASCC